MANENDTPVINPTVVADLEVRVANGTTKKLAAADANALNPGFAAGTILPVHHIADISGSAGSALAALKDAIVIDGTASENALRVSLSNGSIDVQTTAEAANKVKRASVSSFTSPTAVVPDALSTLDKVLTIVISNRTDKPAYIKLHDLADSGGDVTNQNKPGAGTRNTEALASASDYDYVIESYGTYESELPNCRLWHSVIGTAAATGKITVLYTSQE